MAMQWRSVFCRHPRVLAGLFAIYWLAMFLATHMEMPEVKSAPQHTDKAVHLVMYAGFAFLLSAWRSARKPETPKLALLVFAAAAIYAALDEILQIPIESRTADVWDFVTDLIGASLGLLLFWLVRKKLAWLWEPAEDMG